MAMVRQDGTPPFDHRGFRVKNAYLGPLEPMRPQRPAPGVADQRPSVQYDVNDTGIRRDNTPVYYEQHYIPAARGVASWAAWPARPILSQRDVTVNTRVGTTATRWLQNPQAPGTGLHTQAPRDQHSAVTVPRYADDGLGRMSSRRVGRLSPARYDGQSFSQTTRLQGGAG